MHLRRAASSVNIPEMSYGFGRTIQFSPFTSCLGVVSTANTDKELIGIHLGLFQGNTPTAVEDMYWVESLLRWSGYNRQKVFLVGLLDWWPQEILNRLHTLGSSVTERKGGDGNYRAYLSQGKIRITTPPE